MRRLPLLVLLALVMSVPAPVPVWAAGPSKSASASAPAYYRYRNAQGVLVMERSIPPEYVGKGYQVLNAHMQVIQDVPPAVALSEEERKAKAVKEAATSRQDIELRKLYSAPQDAERLRDRQLSALGLKIDHARGQLNQTTNTRKAEIEQAAKLERAGTPPPQAMRDNIDRLTRLAGEQEQQIKTLEAEQLRLRAEFEPIIERLKVIYPDKVAPVPPPAPAPMPAVPAPAAAPPPATPPAVPSPPAKPGSAVPAVPAAPATGAAARPATPPVAPPAANPPVPRPASGSVVASPTAPAAQKPAPAVTKTAPPPAVPAAPKPSPALAPAAKAAVPSASPVAEKETAPAARPDKAGQAEKVVKADKAEKPGKGDKHAAEAAKAPKKDYDLEEEERSAGGLRPTGF